jgi:hypothetical protein
MREEAVHDWTTCTCDKCQGKRWIHQLGASADRLNERPEPRKRQRPESLRLDLGPAAFASKKPVRR